MTFSIPFIFRAGTKAKANEVNDNFTAVKQFVDLLEENTASAELNIAELQNNKANLNGNSQVRFQAADPVNTMDVVNKKSLNEAVGPSKGFINGLVLSKYSNNGVTATAGTCWDSTNEVVIKSESSLTKTQSGLGQNATYYVFVVYNKDTTGVQLIFSLNEVNPELPTGYNYYKLIGNLSTDSNGDINSVSSYSNSIPVSNIWTQMFPNYTNRVGKAVNTTHTADTYGWLYCHTWVVEGSQTYSLVIDGVSFDLGSSLTNREGGHGDAFLFPVAKGSTYRMNGGNCYMQFIPCIGG